MQSRGYTLIVLVAALRCRNYRRNRRVLLFIIFSNQNFDLKQNWVVFRGWFALRLDNLQPKSEWKFLRAAERKLICVIVPI